MWNLNVKLKPYSIILSKYYCSSHFPDWKVNTQQPIASFKVKYTDMKYTQCLVKWLDLPCASTKRKPLCPQILQYFITASRKSGVRFDFPRVDLVAAMKCRHVGIWGLNYHTRKHQLISFLKTQWIVDLPPTACSSTGRLTRTSATH